MQVLLLPEVFLCHACINGCELLLHDPSLQS
jgi:hypothetical protein